MKVSLRLFFSCSILMFFILSGKAQVVTVTNPTNTTPNLAATYTTLANAITALNGITAISGPVIITLNAGNTQMAPVGGYALRFVANTTATNNITISGNNNVINANNVLTSGSLTDAIFKLFGQDHITIENFTMQENPANTTFAVASNNMTEWGVALLDTLGNNGAQHNTIKNNIISLNKTYANTFGIYSNPNHTTTNVIVLRSGGITSAAGANSNNKVYGNSISNVNMGIMFSGCTSTALGDFMDLNNDIGGSSAATGNTITNWGGKVQATIYFASSTSCYGIYSNHQENENISYNTIISATSSGTYVSTRGIYKNFNNALPLNAFTANISNNTITLSSNFSNNTGTVFDFIRSEATGGAIPSSTVNINNNLFLNSSLGGSSLVVPITGISNTVAYSTLNINSNIFRGTTSVATSGGFTGISNTGPITTALNINNNQIGNASGDAITFSAATSGSLIGITCQSVLTSAAVSISNNNFQGFVQTVAGTGAHFYLFLSHGLAAGVTDNVNGNTFTNLIANTSNSATFITASGVMALGGTKNCSGNNIVTAFSKPTTTGNVTIYSSTSTSVAGSTMVQTGNNFSNITVGGSIAITGWNNAEGAIGNGPVKTISNNTFSNWSSVSGTIVALQVNYGAANTMVSGNTVSNMSTSGSITSLNMASGNYGGNQVCSGNAVNNISTGASGSTYGIEVNSSSNTDIFKNKIYNISSGNSGAFVIGMRVAAGTTGVTFNVYNNTIGDIQAPAANASNSVMGISINATGTNIIYNFYYNSIYLNATSTGTDFGSSGLRTITGSATQAFTTIRNNIIVNLSTANGLGKTIALYRPAVSVLNYSVNSNNNIYYAGVASAANVIYYDGTNADQTMAAFKSRVGPTRESNSVTELPPFLSTTGSSPNFLHIDPSAVTRAESRAVNIAGISDDYDANIRQGNIGYAGTGTAPDIGADEVNATAAEINGPVITYTALSSPTCSFSPTISNVTITDETGIPLTGTARPRIYYRKNTGTWYSQPGTNTGGNLTNSTWDFVMVPADMGGVLAGDTVSYYIVAQDVVGIPANISSNPGTGLGAYDVNNIPTPPTSVNIIAINFILNGTYTVGVGGDFSSLTAAVKAYNNACSLDGPIIFELIDDNYNAETFPISINNHADASAVITLTIRPSATAVPVIAGNTAQTIIFNGARFVSIDGRQGGTGSTRTLTLYSTLAGGTTFQFINDAKNDHVRYCNIWGGNTSNFGGTIIFAGTIAVNGTGNDNHTIEFNEIRDNTTTSANAIYSSGTAGKGNDSITIANNLIRDYFIANNRSCGIYIATGSSSWTITGNRFYQTVTRNKTAASFHYGMLINEGTGYIINNNIIGFANESGTGTTNLTGVTGGIPGFPSSYSSATSAAIRFVGIACSLTAGGTETAITSNTVGGMAMFTSSNVASMPGIWCGIYLESGNASIDNNIIGSSSGTSSIYVTSSGNGGALIGIRAASTGFANITNNTIGGITVSGTSSVITTAFSGISFAGAGNFMVNNNQVGNATANNIKQGYFLNGANLSDAGTATATSSVYSVISGIQTTSMSGNSLTLSGNILQGWQTSGTLATISGISASFSTMTGINPTVNINQNALGTAAAGFINYAFTVTGFTAMLTGITFGLSGSYETNIKENDIRGITYNSVLPNEPKESLILYLYGTSTATNGSVYIRKNTFTNISLFSIGPTSVIDQSCQMTTGAKMYVDSNRIVGTFSKTGSGVSPSLTLITSAGSSVSGAAHYCVGNDFSNITVSNAFLIYGIFNIDGASVSNCPAKIISGNILTNWAGGSQIINMIFGSNFGGTTSAITENTLSNISTQAIVYAIRFADASMLKAHDNIINNISSTGSNGVFGIDCAGFIDQLSISKNLIHSLNSAATAGIQADAGAAMLIDQNKIYNINASASNGFSSGIRVRSLVSSTVTLQNNIIGKITAPTTSYGPNGIPVTGIHLLPVLVSSNFDIYNNTVYLDASSSVASFSSAALYDLNNISHNLNLRNNILVNISTPGVSGRTASFWRSGTDLTTYQNSSDNNLFYAGVPGGSNVIFSDETSIDQTLAGFKTRVNPRDDQSVSMLPSFISTTGADATFLHLSTNNNCGILGGGDNTGILLPTDFDNETRLTTDPYIIDIGADEASKLNFWTGSNGSNWNDAANWSTGIVPNSGEMNVSISNPPATQPVIAIGDTYETGNLYINSGATLTNLGTINVSGRIFAPAAGINNFQAAVIRGSITYKGDCISTHTVAGNIFSGNTVKNLMAINHVTLSAVSGEELKVAGTLSFGASTGKTIQTNNNLVLLSSALATAGVADITGNSIIGSASVERFVNTGLVADGRHPKSWQFLATPTKGQTIYQSWQESGTVPAGYGTIITGTGTGFDITTAQPSMKFFDPTIGASGNWSPVTNTGNLIFDQRGYMVFVRGDRSVISSSGTPNPTILRTNGTLFQPNDPPPVTNVLAGKLASVGNPYASAIDVSYMRDNGLFVNLNNDVIVWDPLIYGSYGFGGYQTLSAANDYEPTTGGTDYYPAGVPAPYIQSGQAFFVRSSGLAGTASFTEACKENSSRLVNRQVTARTGKQFFRAGLYTQSGVVADGNAVVFAKDYRNGVDADDAVKLLNSGENFYITRNEVNLSVETRKLLHRNDTIFYALTNLRRQPYQFRFAPKDIYNGRLEAILIDRYLHAETLLSLSDSSFINFTVNEDPASSASNRFYVVFRQKRFAPVNAILSVRRLNDQTNILNWKVENEIDISTYVAERSSNGHIFSPVFSKTPSANNGVLALYSGQDENNFPSAVFYRIKFTGINGSVGYSNIVELPAIAADPFVEVRPNPVLGETIQLHFRNFPSGKYNARLINTNGQVVYRVIILIDQSFGIKVLNTGKSLSSGTYQLELSGTDHRKYPLTVIIQ